MCPALRLAVLIAIVGCAELITVKTPQKHLNVKIGEDALLQCTFETSVAETKNLIIQWNFAASSVLAPDQLVYYQSEEWIISKEYEGRLEHQTSPGTSKNVSISLKNMQPADSGLYSCDVRNFPDVEGTTEANIKVTVLKEPSEPYCFIRGNSHPGHSVIMVCHSEHGSPTPTYMWTRIVNGVQKATSTEEKPLNTGTLAIENITRSDYGTYQCTVKNVAGTADCKVELHESSTDKGTVDTTKAGYIAAVVVGVILACVLLGVSIWLIVRAVNKKKYKGVRQTGGAEMRPSNPE